MGQCRTALSSLWNELDKHCQDRLKTSVNDGTHAAGTQRERSKSCSPKTASNAHKKAADPQQEAARMTGKSLKGVPGIKCCSSLQYLLSNTSKKSSGDTSWDKYENKLLSQTSQFNSYCLETQTWLLIYLTGFKANLNTILMQKKKAPNSFWLSQIFFLSNSKKTEGIQSLRKKKSFLTLTSTSSTKKLSFDSSLECEHTMTA